VVEYYALDAVGSVRVVFDANGTILGRMDYTPFGGELFSGANLPDRRFAGLFRDGEAGLDYAQARSYQVRTGRFNAPDSVYAGMFDPQGWNRYAYGLNQPTGIIDVTGLDPQGTWYPPGTETCGGGPCGTFSSGTTAGGGTPTGGGGSERMFTTPWGWSGVGGEGFFMIDVLGLDIDISGGGGSTQNPQQRPAPYSDPNPNPNPNPDPNPNATPAPTPDPDRPTKWTCFLSNYGFAWKETNRAFFELPWKAARTGAALVTGSAVARSAGLTSPGMVLRDLWRGGIKEVTLIMGVPAVVKSVAASVATNTFLSGVALEGGIIVGSGIDAAYQTFVAGGCR
jgi:RHS repeat-associated protein